jgi:hypothetical protein
MPPRRHTSKKDSPAKLASRMKRRWRIVLIRKTGEVLGTVEAAAAHAAEIVAAVQFELNEQQRLDEWKIGREPCASEKVALPQHDDR